MAKHPSEKLALLPESAASFMRLILTTIILTMLFAPVWASEVADPEPFYGIQTGQFEFLQDRELCEKVIENGAHLGTASHLKFDPKHSSRTETRIFFEGKIYLIVIIYEFGTNTDKFVCLRLDPLE